MTIEELLQPLEAEIEIYSDFNSLGEEKNYIVYSDIVNSPSKYADGKPILRSTNYDIDLFCDNAGKSIFMSKVEEVLKDIYYQRINVGFNNKFQRYQITYTLNLI